MFRVLVSGQGGVPPCPGLQNIGQRRCSAANHGSALPLQPHASLLHKAPFPKVRGSRCAKAPLGAPHRCAPFGYRKQALCKVACAGQRARQPPSLPGRGYTPYAPTPGRPGVLLCPSFQAGASRSVLASGLRPVVLCVPRPPWASPLRGIGPRGLPVRPQGAPSARARVRGSGADAPPAMLDRSL
jgi:hypothetical protein